MDEVSTLGGLAAAGRLTINDGYRTRADELGLPGTPILRVAEVQDGYLLPNPGDHVSGEYRAKFAAKVSQPGDVVVTTKGTVGRVVLMRHDYPEYVYSPQMCFARVPPGSGVEPAFLYYWFRSPQFRNQALGVQSQTDMAPYINLADLRALSITLPDHATQRAIADVLAGLDEKIESNRRLVHLLEEISASEYLAATSGADDVTYADALIVEMGAPFAGKYFSIVGSGRPLIRIRDLKTMEPQIWTTEARSDETTVRAGDVLVGMDAEFRSTLWLGEPGVLNQRMCRFVPKPGVAVAFAWFAIRLDLEYCERAKSGTTVIHLNKSDINRFTVPHLSIDEHRQLQARVDPLIHRLVAAARESSHLAALRDVLLPELLSGRLRIREAEKVIEDVE